MNRILLACAVWLAVSCPAWAGNQEDRFVDFPSPGGTTTYDLSTVQMITPGRFTVIKTSIDDPDVMQFELTVTAILSTYCTRPPGKYPPPTDLLTLGPADMPLRDIEVVKDKVTIVNWNYPYTRLARGSEEGEGSSFCKGQPDSEQAQTNLRSIIMNGFREKQLVDCRRGVWGWFSRESDEKPSTTMLLTAGDVVEYSGVCRSVTHEAPYLPK